MFYYLTGLEGFISAFNIFRYITFRASMAAVTAFILCVIFGPLFIRYFKELKENALRKDCPDLDKLQAVKQGTPTIGGIFIICSIILSVLFWADLSNPYINLTLLICALLALLGWVDDYVKLTQKGKHRGLPGRKKLFYETILGLA